MTVKNEDRISIPTTFIIFGATGDLMRRKLAGSLLNLYCKGFMPESFQVIGISRRDFSDRQFRDYIFENSLKDLKYKFDKGSIEDFLKKITYIKGYFSEESTYKKISEQLLSNTNVLDFCDNKLYYLAVPPKFYSDIFKNLAKSGLTLSCSPESGWTRILVEKPFGRDIGTAIKLDRMLGKLFMEKQIFRIDHYLAKDTIRNILFFRFSNIIFDPAWNNNYIEKVEIKLLEDLDIGTRGSSYDNIGALRDVGQNHILQMLALIAMENPKGYSEEKIREGRVKVLKSLIVMDKPEDIKKMVVRGQYRGYRDHKDVGRNSGTETYFNIKAYLASKRWKGVPFYLESGKALDRKNTEIIIYFRDVIDCICPENQENLKHQNILSIKIFPEEGIFIRFWVKKPGLHSDLVPRDLEFNYKKAGIQGTAEYDKILLDCMRGDQTLFTSTSEVRLAWKYITPILNNWSGTRLHIYEKGSSGPVINMDGGKL
ncbi:MAG: glucose-6-phosphate dehydrogenase [Actinobacteria bacterium]|nr:glucose-6-phosphate dehydrogenase [Actinomycetota bacterium]